MIKKMCLLVVVYLSSCVGEPESEHFIPIQHNSLNISPRILIVSHYTADGDYLQYTLKNHNSYAQHNFYDYWFRNGVINASKYQDPTGEDKIYKLGLYWQKIEAMKQGMALKDDNGQHTYDWVMWMDADAFFTNFSIKIESIIGGLDKDQFLVISRDAAYSGCINAGVWLIKNNEAGRNFINTVESSYPHYKDKLYPEQFAMQDLIYGYVTHDNFDNRVIGKWQLRPCDEQRIIKGVTVLPQRKLNSFYSNYSANQKDVAWRPGDYIAHFAGETDRLSLIKRLMACMKVEGPTLDGCEVNGWWQP